MNDSNPNAATIRVGTRRSPLALWQAQHVSDALERRWKGTVKCELVEVVTEGDKILDRPLNEVGGEGLFVNAIEEKLLSGAVDIAVHSTGTTAHPCTSWEPHWTRVKLSPSSRGDLWCAWSNHFRREHGAMTPEGASPTP